MLTINFQAACGLVRPDVACPMRQILPISLVPNCWRVFPKNAKQPPTRHSSRRCSLPSACPCPSANRLSMLWHTRRGATNSAGHKLRAQIPFRFSHSFVLWQPKDNSNSSSDNCDNFARLHQKFIAKFQLKFAAFFKKNPREKWNGTSAFAVDRLPTKVAKNKVGRMKATVGYPVWKEQKENLI